MEDREKVLYYCLGGGLGHITRFTAFCNTLSIRPILITANKTVSSDYLNSFTSYVYYLPDNLKDDKQALKKWLLKKIKEINPDRLILDAFPAGVLGELADFPNELNSIKIEYISRILKLDTYNKRVEGELPKYSRIWQVEKVGEAQSVWLNHLAKYNNIPITELTLCYPESDVDSKINTPENCWLIVHSGSDQELQELYEYAKDIALLENASPNYVVVGQLSAAKFLPENVSYYNCYPVNNILKKAARVISAAGFNIMQQMSKIKEKHFVLPFNRPLDDQHLRLRLSKQ